ncbi:DNA polymerase-3 subunit delta' [Allochromatium warmingii]|uniref:DNA polymerase III subunit delta' n=1 Tax=Allochromatium warmingii TaxID=61595 RepID=A0A1H3FNT3_ALLWA|nr:DNA polymerase III subunit delta' [Allochromatium warmingii]SDX92467.1 DNA polymerase-3 subunit delta' [Allochromatium warmingii]
MSASTRAESAPTSQPFAVPLPWTEAIWSRLHASRTAQRLAHGLLISGPAGVGKRMLARALAQSLLCQTPNAQGLACAQCADCQLLAAGSHPDWLEVGPDPESKSGEIPIDAVRQFTERESLTPSRAPYKVALIDPADRLNQAAANALLKTLEEPTGQSILCLIGERIGRLPATIRSRCLLIPVAIPDETQALRWLTAQEPRSDWALRLRLAHGAPLRALAERADDTRLEQRSQCLNSFLEIARGRSDPITVAADWNAIGTDRILDWLAGVMGDLLRLGVCATPPQLDHPDRHTELTALAQRLDLAAGHRLLKRILEARALSERNLNQQLLLESLAIDWARIGHAARAGTGGGHA